MIYRIQYTFEGFPKQDKKEEEIVDTEEIEDGDKQPVMSKNEFIEENSIEHVVAEKYKQGKKSVATYKKERPKSKNISDFFQKKDETSDTIILNDNDHEKLSASQLQRTSTLAQHGELFEAGSFSPILSQSPVRPKNSRPGPVLTPSIINGTDCMKL